MRLWPLALLCGGGCAQLFGLDKTTGSADANLDEVSLAVQRVSIGSSVVKAPQDMSGQMATFFVDDGAEGYTTTPATLIPPNTFTAPIVTGTPPVLFTAPDMVSRFFATSRAQSVNFYAFERPGAATAATTSKIMVTATLPSAYVSNESFNLVAIGPWTQHPFAAGELPAPDLGNTAISATFDYTTQFSSMLGSSFTTRPKITSADYVVLLRYVGNRLTGYLETQFDQTDGTDVISGTMTAVATDRTLNATINPTGYATRYSAVRPATTGLGIGWNINAAPGGSDGSSRGIQLMAGGSAMTDTMVTTMYGNPFDGHGWKAVLSFNTASSRTFTFMTAPVPMSATMSTMIDASQATALTLPAGLPITIRANLINLTNDGMILPLDLTKPVVVDANIDKVSATFYSLALFEIEVTGMTSARKLIVDAVTAGMPSFKLPQSLFQVGHHYVLQFRAHDGGFANAAAGDFQTFTLPYSTSSLDSGLFTVVAPQ